MATGRAGRLGGLRWQVSLSLALALAAALAVLSALIVRALDAAVLRAAAAQAGTVAETLERGLAEAMLTRDRARIAHALNDGVRNSLLLETVIADAGGTVRYASRPALVDRAIDELPYRGAAAGRTDAAPPGSRGGPDALYLTREIPNADACRGCHAAARTALGRIGVALSLEPSRGLHALATTLLLALAVAVVALLLLVSRLVLGRRVVAPLARLGEKFSAAGAPGAAAAPGALPPRDEIELLHRQFDGLLAELRRVHDVEMAAERELVAARRDEHHRAELAAANVEIDRQIAALDASQERINRLALQLEEKNRSLEKAVKNISALNRVGVALSSELDIDRLAQLLINISVKGLRVEFGLLLLIDELSGQLVVRASSGLPAGVDAAPAVAPGESVSGLVASSGHPLLIRTVDGSQGIGVRSRFGYQRRSVLCVPIRMKDRVLGTIELTNRRGEESFSEEDLRMLQSIANQAAVAIENAKLYRDVQRSYLETVRALVQAVEEKDRYTRGHSERVTAFSVKIARAMGLTARQERMIQYAGVLHDIGKIGIDLSIIHKNGRLTAEEYAVIKNHPLIGERIIRPIGFLADALPAVAQHHERFDGCGYPLGLDGERMTLEARILAVADAYDAMITERPYRKPLPKAEAVAELLRCSGTQFDPLVVEHFVGILHNDPDVHRLEEEAAQVGT
jgi:HD-GYP domain-containing protein (c-di-GMP phosphodiesterase class II)/HAMP domain-containing protein